MRKNAKRIIIVLTALICGVFSVGCGKKKKTGYKETTTEFIEETSNESTEVVDNVYDESNVEIENNSNIDYVEKEVETEDGGILYVGYESEMPKDLKNVILESSDEGIIKIENGRNIKCVGEGDCIITMYYDGIKMVKTYFTVVGENKEKIKVEDKGTLYLGFVSEKLPDVMTVKSSDESVISVKDGRIRCVGEGTCIITMYNKFGIEIAKARYTVVGKGQESSKGQDSLEDLKQRQDNLGSKLNQTSRGQKNLEEDAELNARSDREAELNQTNGEQEDLWEDAELKIRHVGRRQEAFPYVEIYYSIKNVSDHAIDGYIIKADLLDADGNVLVTKEQEFPVNILTGYTFDYQLWVPWSEDYSDYRVQIKSRN